MMEVWGTMGLATLNADFHQYIFAAAQEGDDFEEIRALRRILRVEMRLNLSRWETMVLHGAITERHLNINTTEKIVSADTDPEIVLVRNAWKGAVPQFPGEYMLCNVVGLAAMDKRFRERLIQQSDSDPDVGQKRLEAFLESPAEETPFFNLSTLERINLNNFLQDPGIGASLERLHETRWVQPTTFPCNGGYSEDAARYLFFPQSALIRLYVKNEAMRPFLTGDKLPL